MLKIGNVYRRETGTLHMHDKSGFFTELNIGDSITVLDVVQNDSKIGSYITYKFLMNHTIYECNVGWHEELDETIHHWSLIC